MEMNTKISVFLVAGNRLLREALARLLSKHGDFDVCGVSPCVPEATSSLAALGTDVLILDSISVKVSDYLRVNSRDCETSAERQSRPDRYGRRP